MVSCKCCLERTTVSKSLPFSSMAFTLVSMSDHCASRSSQCLDNASRASLRPSNPETNSFHSALISQICASIVLLLLASANRSTSWLRSINRSNSNCWFCVREKKKEKKTFNFFNYYITRVEGITTRDRLVCDFHGKQTSRLSTNLYVIERVRDLLDVELQPGQSRDRLVGESAPRNHSSDTFQRLRVIPPRFSALLQPGALRLSRVQRVFQ